MSLPENKPFARIAALAVFLAFFSLPRHSAATQNSVSPSDETALRDLIFKYFDYQAKKDLEGFISLWAENAPGLETRREAMQRIFESSDSTFSDIIVSRIKIEGDRAGLRASAMRTDISTQGTQLRIGKIILDIQCVKTVEEWKVFQDAPAVSRLVTALTNAKTDEEISGLLSDEELMTRELQLSLSGQADRFYNQRDYPQALKLSRILKTIAERLDNKSALATALNNIGNIHILQGDYRSALESFQQGLAIYEALGNKFEVAGLITGIAQAYSLLGRNGEALTQYQKALALYETLADKVGIANTLDRMGNVNYELGSYDLAEEHYQKSIALRNVERDKLFIANSLHQVGEVQHSRGNEDMALSYYNQALAQFQSLDNKQGIIRELHSMANIYYLQGDYTSALAGYQRSLALGETIRYGRGMASSLYGIGLTHFLQGNYGPASEYYNRTLSLQQSLGDKPGMAITLQSAGNLHFKQGRYETALEHYQRNLTLNESLQERSKATWAMLDIGLVYAAQGDYDQALSHFHQSRSRFEAMNDLSGQASALLNEGQVHYFRQQYELALNFADQATAIARHGDIAEILWRARFRAGNALRRLNRPAEARKAYEEAISLIESRRGLSIGVGSEPSRLFDDMVLPYLSMVDLLIAQGDANEAFAYAERAKFKTLHALLQNRKAQITKTMTRQEQERERRFKNEIASLNTRIYREQQKASRNTSRLAVLDSRRSKAQRDYEAYLKRLYLRHSDLKVMRGEADSITPVQAADLLGNIETALLEYVETGEAVYLFTLTRDRAQQGRRRVNAPPTNRLQAYVLGVRSGELAGLIKKFRKLIADRDEAAQETARELFGLLLEPAREQLKGKTRLVIVPDGILWQLPFHALQLQDGHFLIEDHEVSFAPSLTSLRAMRKRHSTINRRADSASLLAFGNPALKQGTIDRLKTALPKEMLSPIPDAEIEVEALGELYGTQRSQVFTASEAREERAKAEAGKYAVLHLAARATMNDASPIYSNVLLASSEEGTDGVLEAWELLDWDLKPGLVIISGGRAWPETLGTGRGLISLNWAFYVAGRPNLLMSQWQADSEITTALMTELHRQLKSQSPRAYSLARAWRKAVLDFLQRAHSHHPYHWAGFWVLGD